MVSDKLIVGDLEVSGEFAGESEEERQEEWNVNRLGD